MLGLGLLQCAYGLLSSTIIKSSETDCALRCLATPIWKS